MVNHNKIKKVGICTMTLSLISCSSSQSVSTTSTTNTHIVGDGMYISEDDRLSIW